MKEWKYIDDEEHFVELWLMEQDWQDRLNIFGQLITLGKLFNIKEMELLIQGVMQCWREINVWESKHPEVQPINTLTEGNELSECFQRVALTKQTQTDAM